MKKKWGCLILVVVLLLSMPGCSAGKGNALTVLDKDHAAVVENDLEVFSKGNISEITQSVFGTTSDTAPSDDSGNGIISDLFANADTQVSSVDESTITYTIVSPDISDFFSTKAKELQEITTTEELRQALIDYAKTAPEKEYTVTLNYSISEAGIEVAYDDPEFINAMTGGLIDAYADLYDQYLEREG